MTARILVVEHQASCPPHLVGLWLEEAGCTLSACRPYAGDALPALTSYDAVLVMGGDMGAYDDDRAPWLSALKALVRDAVEASVPALGIDPLPKSLYDAIAVAENSELLAETLGEHVFDFFLRNKRAEWEEYRTQVSAYERDRMLPVL